MVATPCPVPWTTPAELTDATPEADDDQVTYGVTFSDKPLCQYPVAVSCCGCPTAVDRLTGVTAMEFTDVSDPVPDKAAVCGLVLALSTMVRVPVRVPSMVGVKVTEILQLAPAASVFGVRGQVEVWAKLPEVEILEIVSVLVELFLTLIFCAALVCVGIWLAKVILVADKVTGRVPVPLKEEVWGELEALSVTVSVPVRLPDASGVKVTEIVHVAPGASTLGDSGQVEVCAKLADVEILLMVRGVV